jgi:hypothetical protein
MTKEKTRIGQRIATGLRPNQLAPARRVGSRSGWLSAKVCAHRAWPGNGRQCARRLKTHFADLLGQSTPESPCSWNRCRRYSLKGSSFEGRAVEMAGVRLRVPSAAPYCHCDRCHERSGGSSDLACGGARMSMVWSRESMPTCLPAPAGNKALTESEKQRPIRAHQILPKPFADLFRI